MATGRGFSLSGIFSRLSGMQMPRVKPMSEMGVSGTAVWGGYVQNKEKSSQWVGRQKYVTISDLATNISIVAAGVHYFLNLIAHPNWSIRPADDKNPEAVRLAEWLDEVLNSMTTPWYAIVRKAAVYRFYGFGVQEWTATKLTDGSIGFKDIESRPQHTIELWDVADDGTVQGIWQRSPQTGQLLGLPRGKVMYMVDDTLTDSPEGLGMFRHMAEPYNRLKQFYDLEMRAYERDLRGIPIGHAPLTAINKAVKVGALKKEEASSLVSTLQRMVETQVKGSSTGLVLDSQPYVDVNAGGESASGHKQWGFELLNGPGNGMVEIASAIDRTQREIARIIGVEHLMMGDAGGNRALSADKSRNLYLVANSVLKNIASQAKHDLVKPLWLLNGLDDTLMPTLETEDVAFKDVDQVTAALQRMAGSGAILAPNDPVIDDVRDLLGVSRTPEVDDGGALRGEPDEGDEVDPELDPNDVPDPEDSENKDVKPEASKRKGYVRGGSMA